MAGYSGTPLTRKLGIKSGSVLYAVNAPASYSNLLGPLPAAARIVRQLNGSADLIHCFSKDRNELKGLLPGLMRQIVPDGMIWVSWPKKASGIPSTITEDVVREIAIPLGLVDTKVCAVDNVWSGLKLVIRLEHRQSRRAGWRNEPAEDATENRGSRRKMTA